MARIRLEAEAPVDLQLHTVYSDGHWTPAALVRHLAKHGFRVAAVTDHDTLAHVEPLQTLGTNYGVVLVPAVEVTTRWRGLPAHLLCYGVSPACAELAALVRTTEQEQYANTLAVYETLRQQGRAFPHQEELLATQAGAVRRPVDNARLLLDHGYAITLDEALDQIRAAGYVQSAAPLEAAVAAAHAGGALAVLAHPGRGGGELFAFEPALLAELAEAVPLDGIEVYYPTHTPDQVADYLRLASERRLLVSAGSDSHGPRQRYPVTYPARCCADLLARLDIADVE
jgi:predicted metal-dependent phosphoesterase TrpH